MTKQPITLLLLKIIQLNNFHLAISHFHQNEIPRRAITITIHGTTQCPIGTMGQLGIGL